MYVCTVYTHTSFQQITFNRCTQTTLYEYFLAWLKMAYSTVVNIQWIWPRATALMKAQEILSLAGLQRCMDRPFYLSIWWSGHPVGTQRMRAARYSQHCT